MKRGTPDHPKVLMLASRLKLPKYAAVGLLECLWHFTARYAGQGDIGRYENDIIADALGWKKEPDVLIEALIAEKWLDAHEKYRLIVHDWSDHSDDTCNKYLASQKLSYCDGKPARKKGKEMKTPDAGEKTPDVGGRTPDVGGRTPDVGEKTPANHNHNHNHNHNQNHTHNQESGESELLNPDEAHRLLKTRPELSLLTWEQDVMARKDVMGLEMYGGQKLDFVSAARKIAQEAVIAGPRDVPGYWLRKQYQAYFTKKDAAPGAGSDPNKRVFVGDKPPEKT
ncbi:MAG: hypothetical protein WC331_10925 [Candidatus Omnitrophota bacterium]|jgi:hypothetical protein